jgi:hypothetical protein
MPHPEMRHWWVCLQMHPPSYLQHAELSFADVLLLGTLCIFAGQRSSSLSNLHLAKTLIYINSNYKLTNQRFGGVATENCGCFTR